jgi:hypothetical protein
MSWNILRDNASCADQSIFADGHSAEHGGTRADRRTSPNEGSLAAPIGVRLEPSPGSSSPWTAVIDEGNAVPDKDLGFDRYAFADKRMARDLAAFAYFCALLNFDERPDPSLSANLAAVEIHKAVNPNIAPEFYIRCDELNKRRPTPHAATERVGIATMDDAGSAGDTIPCDREKVTGAPFALSEVEAASRTLISSSPA